ncbi:DUF72 domain-containing protein [Nocardioides sp.]|uniref:DUF72 domain-containing protein n=1 Tax=Nocardioides sp. TaxID=35761 RepID=UPI002C746F81|nr:DUF72 domain-containing protein [Nocardioides sp.]HVX54237.1 DUF72 domain-containing protein [Nocardioides sp.]
MSLHLGTSGWSYDHWEGVLYPPGLPVGRRREVYTETFTTVELNASFYRWPGERPFHRWGQSLPDDFRMSVKASRWLTHGHRLRDPDGAWARRLGAAMEALGKHAGVVLLQLADDFERDDERLSTFLGSLPTSLRVAVELRHPSWDDDGVYQLLEHHRAAYVVTSGARLRCVLRATAPFVYVRWHGPSEHHLYAGSYSADDLRWWADRIREWQAQGRDVWGYFNNDGAGNAVRNCRDLIGLLDGPQIGV